MPIQHFIDGFKAFRKEYYVERPDSFRTLVEQGQNPTSMIIACSDSRVDPSIVGKAEPGELFVVRNVANIVPPYEPKKGYDGTIAAIEFGVCGLEVCDLVIMGHSHCAGIKMLCEGDNEIDERPFVSRWMSTIQDFDRNGLEGEELLRHAEKEAVKISLSNLMSFPWLSDRVKAGNLMLHGLLFDLELGTLLKHSSENEWIQL